MRLCVTSTIKWTIKKRSLFTGNRAFFIPYFVCVRLSPQVALFGRLGPSCSEAVMPFQSEGLKADLLVSVRRSGSVPIVLFIVILGVPDRDDRFRVHTLLPSWSRPRLFIHEKRSPFRGLLSFPRHESVRQRGRLAAPFKLCFRFFFVAFGFEKNPESTTFQPLRARFWPRPPASFCHDVRLLCFRQAVQQTAAHAPK